MTLPPEVSLHKAKQDEAQVYEFTHATLGDLGRIRLKMDEHGNLNLMSEVAGHPEDPMTKVRKDMFLPLAETFTNQLHAESLKGIEIKPESPPASVETKLLSCERCKQSAALLIFVNAKEPSEFENIARILFPKYQAKNVPTWLIGPSQAESGEEMAPIMKVWPDKQSLGFSTPTAFNTELDQILDNHCAE